MFNIPIIRTGLFFPTRTEPNFTGFMTNQSNLNDMTIRGWEAKYVKILKKFGYSRKQDEDSAWLLESVLKGNTKSSHLKNLISKKPVIIVGAGPSISKSLPILKKYKKTTMIAADSAIQFLIENKIYPDIVVTDLDGDEKSLLKTSQKSIMVVHAHGDNMEKIPMVENFPKCIGTTQSKSFGQISNFGGFTDGDRAVFLAHHFGAKKIILLGMDFGGKIGRYSNTKRVDRQTKLKKLKEAESLLVWLYAKNQEIYSTTAIKGAQRITHDEIKDIIIT